MDMRNLLMAAALFWPSVYGLATGAQAGETVLLFEDTDDLPPPYKQWWYATQADNSSYDQAYEVFIRGEGKRGDFLVFCGSIASTLSTPSASPQAEL